MCVGFTVALFKDVGIAVVEFCHCKSGSSSSSSSNNDNKTATMLVQASKRTRPATAFTPSAQEFINVS